MGAGSTVGGVLAIGLARGRPAHRHLLTGEVATAYAAQRAP